MKEIKELLEQGQRVTHPYLDQMIMIRIKIYLMEEKSRGDDSEESLRELSDSFDYYKDLMLEALDTFKPKQQHQWRKTNNNNNTHQKILIV